MRRISSPASRRPAGAGLALFPLFAALAFEEWGWTALAGAARHPAFSGALLVVVGGLMVSTLPTWSFKNFKVPAEYVLPLLLGIGAYVGGAADRALGGAGRRRADLCAACCRFPSAATCG